MLENRRRLGHLRSGLYLLLLASSPRAATAQEPFAIGLQGGFAGLFSKDLEYLVGPVVPFRLDVELGLSEHLRIAPFLGAGWVPGQTYTILEPAPDGFRLLVGAELQLHGDARPGAIDVFGGLAVAFERLVAHARVGSCGHCNGDLISIIANGANFELRAGILFPLGNVVKIGPYVGAQLSWMPGLAPVDVQYLTRSWARGARPRWT